MFEIDNAFYFINFKAIDKLLNLGNEDNPTGKFIEEMRTKYVLDENTGELKISEQDVSKYFRSKEIDTLKYGLIQQMLDIVMPDEFIDDEDESKALPNNETHSKGYKLAFNTLLMYGIIEPYLGEKKDI